MNIQVQPRSARIAKSLVSRNEEMQWEIFIVSMLKKLELSPENHAKACRRYAQFAHHIAQKLGVDDDDVHVVVQGSMRTQTTIAGDGREKFDLDVVVKLSGPRFERLRDSGPFFEAFGEALEGLEGAGKPEAKNRCWRLPYPNEPFYFDVTPAIPLSQHITGANLRVRDEEQGWSPSNPEEFADWFCTIADKRFIFRRSLNKAAMDSAKVDPIPDQPIGIDDVLRRMVQLMKLHRDSYYKKQSDARRVAKPISVILVTLAAKAYDEMALSGQYVGCSAIEVALELVTRMPAFIQRGREIRVENPAMIGVHGENFAEKWNTDGGVRDQEFQTWHAVLERDLEALFSEEYSKRSENRVHAVFGELGVTAWKSSHGSGILAGLRATAPGLAGTHPAAPRSTGSSNTLA
ncbi:nucleotidyltransferase domain-containing protein [Pseudomonas frederiksbergensis]|uniref:Cyclic GMP-AMP synthase n=1 Tax=Pseudomonas frederiksbergensis TaxID=104087 RepID=A0A423KG34_9PSED|nr:nucleotidyltransferase [Pseudomonas frederiksbergensis]RON51770.1 nucleotidyltransferase [Pseudomonas frederiksbergensis]